MTTASPRTGQEPPSLRGAPWLELPATRAVLAALAAAGFEGRIVGGTVRNTLMGLPVSDIDIATPAPPRVVVEACRKAGLATVPTGLEHGTVTVVAHRTPIEVTTLRRDVSTDGRRATVAFTDDWGEDAGRRDFTMNALYCDGEGRIYDPIGGYPDLASRRVRFIGNPDRRIAEDYLRILRFFRFHAAYAEGDPDPDAMAACARGIAGMGLLSAERIRAELVRLLVAKGAVTAVEAMAQVGLLPLVLGAAPRPGVLAAVAAAEARAKCPAEAMLRLSALAVAVEDDIPRLAARLRLSGDERKALLVIDGAMLDGLGTIDARRARRMVYGKGRDASRRGAIALAALAPGRAGEAATLLATAVGWQPPRLSVAGADVVALGVPPGPAVGALLRRLEQWWVENDFPGEPETRARLDEIVSGLCG
ncbi:MAG: CCA tRNA nucleotidyltransferase [Hyphomicrobiaceae bacterium]